MRVGLVCIAVLRCGIVTGESLRFEQICLGMKAAMSRPQTDRRGVGRIPAGYRIALAVAGSDYEYLREPVCLSHFKGGALRGSGIYLHDDPDDRPADVYDGDVTLHLGGHRDAYLLLSVVPPERDGSVDPTQIPAARVLPCLQRRLGATCQLGHEHGGHPAREELIP